LGLPHEIFGLRYSGVTCCDQIISGHTCMLLVNSYLITTFLNSHWLQYFIWILALWGSFTIIVPGLHYTVDVLLTILLVLGLMSIYRHIAHDVRARHYHLHQIRNEMTSSSNIYISKNQKMQS